MTKRKKKSENQHFNNRQQTDNNKATATNLTQHAILLLIVILLFTVVVVVLRWIYRRRKKTVFKTSSHLQWNVWNVWNGIRMLNNFVRYCNCICLPCTDRRNSVEKIYFSLHFFYLPLAFLLDGIMRIYLALYITGLYSLFDGSKTSSYATEWYVWYLI